jgi:hypothetical protein
MTQYDEEQLSLGLADLSRFERGATRFAIGPNGLTYVGTEATVKMREGEGLNAFFARLRTDHDLRVGDVVTLLNNGGKLDTARIERKPRVA